MELKAESLPSLERTRWENLKPSGIAALGNGLIDLIECKSLQVSDTRIANSGDIVNKGTLKVSPGHAIHTLLCNIFNPIL